MRSPLENSPDHITALGTIAARWATLDTILATVLGQLIGNLATGSAVYFSSSSTQLRLDCIRAVVLHGASIPDTRRERYRALLDNLGDLWKRRNTFLHNSAVASSANPDAIYSVWLNKPLREPSQTFAEMPVKELQLHADRISTIGSELFELTFPELIQASREARDRASGDKPPSPG